MSCRVSVASTAVHTDVFNAKRTLMCTFKASFVKIFTAAANSNRLILSKEFQVLKGTAYNLMSQGQSSQHTLSLSSCS